MVFRYVYSLCKEEAWAEEITQEAFFKALKSIDAFRGECKLSAWLCQIAKKHFLYPGKAAPAVCRRSFGSTCSVGQHGAKTIEPGNGV